jgi:hypothetical protein
MARCWVPRPSRWQPPSQRRTGITPATAACRCPCALPDRAGHPPPRPAAGAGTGRRRRLSRCLGGRGWHRPQPAPRWPGTLHRHRADGQRQGGGQHPADTAVLAGVGADLRRKGRAVAAHRGLARHAARNRGRAGYRADDLQVDDAGIEAKDHWATTAFEVVAALVLHVLYDAKAKGTIASLSDVAMRLSDPGRHANAVWAAMRTNRHLDGAEHPFIAGAGRAMLNRPARERDSILSVARTNLTLVKAPIVAANTRRSDFRLADLMNHERPVSLYTPGCAASPSTSSRQTKPPPCLRTAIAPRSPISTTSSISSPPQRVEQPCTIHRGAGRPARLGRHVPRSLKMRGIMRAVSRSAAR